MLDVRVITERDTGASKGYGFVTMDSPASCQSAMRWARQLLLRTAHVSNDLRGFTQASVPRGLSSALVLRFVHTALYHLLQRRFFGSSAFCQAAETCLPLQQLLACLDAGAWQGSALGRSPSRCAWLEPTSLPEVAGAT